MKLKIPGSSRDFVEGGGRALGAVISKIHPYKDIGFKTFESLFNTCVVHVLDYCSGVWGFNNFSCVDGVQNHAIRYFLGSHRFTSLLALNGEAGWLPATQRRWRNMFRMWNRLVMMEEDD